MNKKIPLRSLAENVSNRTGIEVEKAHLYIKTLFNVIGEQLLQTKSISLDGLVEFVATHNPDDPIRFNVDSNFADELNAPFAMFESVDIPVDVDRIELEKLSEDTEEKELDKAFSNDLSNELNQKENHQDRQGDNEDEVLDDRNNSIGVVSDNVTAESEDIIKFELVETQIKVQIENEPEIVEEANPVNDSETSNMHDTDIDSDLVVESSKIPEEEEEFVDENTNRDTNSASKFGIGFILGFVTGLIISALGFVSYILYFVETGSKLF